MLRSERMIDISWRGNYIFTPGTGHGRGCITLLSSAYSPTILANIDDRGHIFSLPNGNSNLIIANVYARTGQNREKIDFFTHLRDKINEIQRPGDDIIIAGDLNTIFHDYECKNRSYNEREMRTAGRIGIIIESMSLTDSWEAANDKTTHTWRKNSQSSRLDRVLYNLENVNQIRCVSDWTFTNSDHCAIVVELSDTSNGTRTANKTLKLDPTKLLNSRFKEAFLREFNSMTNTIPTNWNPHETLEFHKCCIRSSYIIASQETRRQDDENFEGLKEQLHTLIEAAEKSRDRIAINRLTEK